MVVIITLKNKLQLLEVKHFFENKSMVKKHTSCYKTFRSLASASREMTRCMFLMISDKNDGDLSILQLFAEVLLLATLVLESALFDTIDLWTLGRRFY